MNALQKGMILLVCCLALSCSRQGTIVVGAKTFTEGYLLGHMAVMLLQEAGYDVHEQFGVATAAMRSALESGQIDLYFEYTGTAYTVYANGSDPDVMIDSARVFQVVKHFDETTNGLTWLAPLPFNNTYTLLMKQEKSDELGINSIEGLKEALENNREIKIAVDAEFYERPDGLKALFNRYDFPEGVNVVKLDAGLTYKALIEGEVEVSMGYSTDGQIPAYDLVSLQDNRSFFPAYNPAAVVRMDLLTKEPGVQTALEKLNRHISTDIIRGLNAEVNLTHRDPRKVAADWLRQQGLIK